ncbi:MAG: S8 family serine peptidase [Burkholderiales bacterium]|nr:S8 family serine peptidase [Burkholderiales bacterium]
MSNDAPAIDAAAAALLQRYGIEAFEPGQLIILWDDAGEVMQGLAILARDYGLRPAERIELGNLGGDVATFQLPSQEQAIQLRMVLRKKYPAWYIDFHARYMPLDGPRIYLPAKIDMPPQPAQASNVRIGMLDSEVAAIPALRNVRLTQRSFVPSGEIPAAKDHGTAVAVLIAGRDSAAKFRSLAEGAQLYAGGIMRDRAGLRVSNTVMLLQGLDWLAGNSVRVINLSLGGPGDELMARAFDKLLARGVVVVAAAGNSGSNAPPSYPAAYPGVIAVTAVDALDRIYRDANRGSYVAIAAPGVDVWVPDGANGHYVSGTSFAAAVATGGVAAMLSSNAGLRGETVRDILCRHSRDLGSPGSDDVFGCGLIQIGHTLRSMK